MDIITKTDAEAAGLTRYFTGEPCPKGHVAPRRTINRACTICTAEYQKARHARVYADPEVIKAARARAKQWRLENPEKYAENQKRWGRENKEEKRAYNAGYRKENAARIRKKKAEADHAAIHKRRYKNPGYAEKCRKRAQKWRRDHPESYNDNNKKWRAANPDRAAAIARTGSINRRARAKNAGKISVSDLRIVRAAVKCAACERVHPRMEIDHIVALSRGGTNHISNLQLLCRPCNRSKWAKDQTAWAKERGLKLPCN